MIRIRRLRSYTPAADSAASPAVVQRVALRSLPRLIRFALVGATCAGAQLLLFFCVVRLGTEAHLANVGAFLASTQLNFFLSAAFTWRDRQALGGGWTAIGTRLLAFNAMALGTLILNQLAFALAIIFVPGLVASALGIGASAVLNYFLSRFLIFRQIEKQALPEFARQVPPEGRGVMNRIKSAHGQQ